MGYEKMGIVVQLLSLREKNSARERERGEIGRAHV